MYTSAESFKGIKEILDTARISVLEYNTHKDIQFPYLRLVKSRTGDFNHN